MVDSKYWSQKQKKKKKKHDGIGKTMYSGVFRVADDESIII